jgi:prophage regulatory protein
MSRRLIRRQRATRRSSRRFDDYRDATRQLSLQLEFASEPKPAARAALIVPVQAMPESAPEAAREVVPSRPAEEPSRPAEAVPGGADSPPESDPGPPDSFMRLAAVKAATGLGRSTIYARIRQGRFPRPIRLDCNAVAWSSSAIRTWMQRRIAEGGEQGS